MVVSVGILRLSQNILACCALRFMCVGHCPEFQAAVPTSIRENLRRIQNPLKGVDVPIVEIDATLRSHPWVAEEVLRFCIAFNKYVEPRTYLDVIRYKFERFCGLAGMARISG